MTTSKYSKYVLPAPIMRPMKEGKFMTGYNFPSLYSHKGEINADFTMAFHYMTEPYKEVYPHTHEGHEVLCFIGSNPKNLNEFDAEIVLEMGEECEPQTITKPSVISIPPGLVHGPLTFKRVGKPVFFLEVTTLPKGNYEMSPEGMYDKK